METYGSLSVHLEEQAKVLDPNSYTTLLPFNNEADLEYSIKTTEYYLNDTSAVPDLSSSQ
jgi:hypothetical protein